MQMSPSCTNTSSSISYSPSSKTNFILPRSFKLCPEADLSLGNLCGKCKCFNTSFPNTFFRKAWSHTVKSAPVSTHTLALTKVEDSFKRIFMDTYALPMGFSDSTARLTKLLFALAKLPIESTSIWLQFSTTEVICTSSIGWSNISLVLEINSFGDFVPVASFISMLSYFAFLTSSSLSVRTFIMGMSLNAMKSSSHLLGRLKTLDLHPVSWTTSPISIWVELIGSLNGWVSGDCDSLGTISSAKISGVGLKTTLFGCRPIDWVSSGLFTFADVLGVGLTTELLGCWPRLSLKPRFHPDLR